MLYFLSQPFKDLEVYSIGLFLPILPREQIRMYQLLIQKVVRNPVLFCQDKLNILFCKLI